MPFGVRLVCHMSRCEDYPACGHEVTNAFRREAGLSRADLASTRSQNTLSPMPFGVRLVCHSACRLGNRHSIPVTNAFRREAGLSPSNLLDELVVGFQRITNAFRREAGLSRSRSP